jgi:hypothetical protein
VGNCYAWVRLRCAVVVYPDDTLYSQSPDFRPNADIWVYQTALLLIIFGTLCSDRMAHEMVSPVSIPSSESTDVGIHSPTSSGALSSLYVLHHSICGLRADSCCFSLVEGVRSSRHGLSRFLRRSDTTLRLVGKPGSRRSQANVSLLSSLPTMSSVSASPSLQGTCPRLTSRFQMLPSSDMHRLSPLSR